MSRPTPHLSLSRLLWLRRSASNPLTLALLASVWIAVFANWPLWRALWALPEMASSRGLVFMCGFAAMVAAVTTAMLSLAAWRWTVKPVIALFLVAAAVGAHFMGNYGVVIDPTMMLNVLQTNPREAMDLLSPRLGVTLAVLAGIPLVWLWRVECERLGFFRQLARNLGALTGAAIVVAALLFALFADMAATMRNHKSMRYLINPANSFWALGVLAREASARPMGPPLSIGTDARIVARRAGARPPLLLLVIGETARADHFSLNGYARLTNPELAKLDVLSFRDVTSCGTSTATALPCMFSHLGRQGFESRERDHENLLDVVQRAGMAVLWLDNQSGCKSVCERVPVAQARDAAAAAPAPPAALCSEGECLDEVLLHGLDARMAALPAQQREHGVLLVMHAMGSHGPAYFKRAPAGRKPFLPECTTNLLQKCDPQALINAYDNSIAYTDHVLAGSVQWLKLQAQRHDPALLYISDHGESLGENNLYLHGMPFALAPRAQTHVPMIAWLPTQSEAASGVRTGCLRQRLDAALSHDHLFHTVLGLLGIHTQEYRHDLDAFAPCRAG